MNMTQEKNLSARKIRIGQSIRISKSNKGDPDHGNLIMDVVTVSRTGDEVRAFVVDGYRTVKQIGDEVLLFLSGDGEDHLMSWKAACELPVLDTGGHSRDGAEKVCFALKPRHFDPLDRVSAVARHLPEDIREHEQSIANLRTRKANLDTLNILLKALEKPKKA